LPSWASWRITAVAHHLLMLSRRVRVSGRIGSPVLTLATPAEPARYRAGQQRRRSRRERSGGTGHQPIEDPLQVRTRHRSRLRADRSIYHDPDRRDRDQPRHEQGHPAMEPANPMQHRLRTRRHQTPHRPSPMTSALTHPQFRNAAPRVLRTADRWRRSGRAVALVSLKAPRPTNPACAGAEFGRSRPLRCRP
jgi:hypothetical protein